MYPSQVVFSPFNFSSLNELMLRLIAPLSLQWPAGAGPLAIQHKHHHIVADRRSLSLPSDRSGERSRLIWIGARAPIAVARATCPTCTGGTLHCGGRSTLSCSRAHPAALVSLTCRTRFFLAAKPLQPTCNYPVRTATDAEYAQIPLVRVLLAWQKQACAGPPRHLRPPCLHEAAAPALPMHCCTLLHALHQCHHP